MGRQRESNFAASTIVLQVDNARFVPIMEMGKDANPISFIGSGITLTIIATPFSSNNSIILPISPLLSASRSPSGSMSFNKTEAGHQIAQERHNTLPALRQFLRRHALNETHVEQLLRFIDRGKEHDQI